MALIWSCERGEVGVGGFCLEEDRHSVKQDDWSLDPDSFRQGAYDGVILGGTLSGFPSDILVKSPLSKLLVFFEGELLTSLFWVGLEELSFGQSFLGVSVDYPLHNLPPPQTPLEVSTKILFLIVIRSFPLKKPKKSFGGGSSTLKIIQGVNSNEVTCNRVEV